MNELKKNVETQLDKALTHEKIHENPKDLLRRHIISIRPLHKGCVVEVGCKAFAFNSIERALEQIKKYTEDPIETAKFYNDQFN